MAHRQPGTAAWDLAQQSKRLWQERCSAADGAALIDWQVMRRRCCGSAFYSPTQLDHGGLWVMLQSSWA